MKIIYCWRTHKSNTYYTEEEIRLAIDIASGDDGYMSNRTIGILKYLMEKTND
tara:strand:+ start:3111 stop:3269 length:159 start_codon:yes stop_codon:yes gene_type:complete